METSVDRPLRVAVVGSGPAGFYVVQHLVQALPAGHLHIDMYDRLPTPFGLVRHGVAPDHQKIKNVTAAYDKLARRPEFSFFGNVEFGRDLSLSDLAERYHQVVFATGAETDRRLGIPGEDLRGSHPATEFVAWYNGHPDYVDRTFALDCRRALVVGVGNVAVDVARILCRTPAELERTDIADHALDALRRSSIEEVWLLGRRGPAQAAFSNPEIKELGELEGARAVVRPEEVELDPLSREAVERDGDKATRRRLEILGALAERGDAAGGKRLVLRFLVSPTELLDDGAGRVGRVRLVRNELIGDGGSLRARATDEVETVDAGLVFRSVGYRGVPLPGLPFREDRGTVPHRAGRIVSADETPLPGLYVAGWIKRGPSGVIGTNKPDALETVESMVADLAADRLAGPAAADAPITDWLRGRGIDFITYDDWCRLDGLERERGKTSGRPRVKFTDRAEIRAALEGDPPKPG